MLLTVQFPLADMRKILDAPARIKKPVWPLPDPRSDFVRFFGSIRERRAGGLINWGSENENLICEATRALTFRSDLSFSSSDRISKYIIVLCHPFTRYYFDGYAVGKIEIGVSTKTRHRVTLTSSQTKELLDHVLRLPARVRLPLEQGGSKQTKDCELAEAGWLLARLYLAASTLNQMRTPDTLANWQVEVGAPLAFLEYEPGDSLEIPSSARALTLPGIAGVQLHHYKIPYKKTGLVVHTWLLGHDSTADFQQARALRLHLLRLHSEHECLKAVLRNIELGNIAPERGTPVSDNLQFYLDRSLKRIKKLDAKSDRQFTVEIAEIARNAAEQVDQGNVDTLLASVEKLDMRKTLVRRLEEHVAAVGPVGQLTVVNGDQIIVSNTSGGFVAIKSPTGNVTQNVGTPQADQSTQDESKHLVATS